MNISGIRPYSGFYNVNSISQANQNLKPVEEAPAISQEKEGVSLSVSRQSAEAAKSRQTFGSYDYANQYRPTENFEIRSDKSDLRSLDVEKAISDMRKDEAIQQYQVFVGDDMKAAAPSIRGGEDFSL